MTGTKPARIDSHSPFDSDPESVDPSSDSSDEDNPVTEERKYSLDVEDEFLLVLMKLRLIYLLDLMYLKELFLNCSQLGLITYMYVLVI